jgi:excisionase family DNA binding protein
MTTREAADALMLSVDSIREMAKDGRLVPVRLGRRTMRFRRADIDAIVGGKPLGKKRS